MAITFIQEWSYEKGSNVTIKSESGVSYYHSTCCSYSNYYMAVFKYYTDTPICAPSLTLRCISDGTNASNYLGAYYVSCTSSATPSSSLTANSNTLSGKYQARFRFSYNCTGPSGSWTSGTSNKATGTCADSVIIPAGYFFVYVGQASGSGWTTIAAHKNSVSGWPPVLTAKTCYTVSYHANGGSGAPSAQTKIHGTALTLSSTKPTRTGYTFAGWNTNSSGTGTNYSAGGSYSSNANATLYAKWTAHTYSVKYNGNGNTGGSMSNSSHTYGVAKALSANGFTKTGHQFAGWATSSTGSVVYADKASVSNLTATNGGTVNLYAKWTVLSYTASFDSNGGSAASPASITKNYGVALGTLPTTSRTGHTFAGWFTAKSGGTQISTTTTMPAGGATYYAHWTKNKYTFTLGSGTGVSTSGSSASGSYEYQSTITLKATATTGYTWNKWTSNNSSVSSTTTANTTFSMPAGAVTMTPSATPNTYYIQYNGNGATGGSTAKSTHTYNVTKTLTANGFTKPGYEFLGWSTSATGDVEFTDQESVKNLSAVNGATVGLYAIWKPMSQMFIWHDGEWHRALRYVYTTQ